MSNDQPTLLSYTSAPPTFPNQHFLRRGLFLYGVIVLATAALTLLRAMLLPLIFAALSTKGFASYMNALAWMTLVQIPLYLALTALTVLAVWWFTAPCGSQFSPTWRWLVRGSTLAHLAGSILTLPISAVSVYNYFNWETPRGRFTPAPWWNAISTGLSYFSLALSTAATILILCHLARLAGAVAARSIRIQFYLVLALSLALTALSFALPLFYSVLVHHLRGSTFGYVIPSLVLSGASLIHALWLAALALLLAYRLRPLRP